MKIKKRKTYILLTLTLTAIISGLTVWNLQANKASAQNYEINENLEIVNGATEYNARNEFALTQGGTTGVWRYGYTANDASNAFSEYTLTSMPPICGSSAERWYFSNSGDGLPEIIRFLSPLNCVGTPTDSLYVHPSSSGQRSVLRWVAPAAGTYQLTGAIQRANSIATTDIRIIQNETTSLFAGDINSKFQESFNVTVTVAANDTIDFSVGFGNGSFNSDGTSLNVTVAQQMTACLTAPTNLQVFVPGENSPSDVQSPNTNAQLVGDAAYTNMGKVGRAFELDGNGDYVRIEDNAAQRPANAVTAEGWFKFDNVGGVVSLISKPLRNSNLNSYSLYLDGGQLRGIVGNASQFTRALSGFTPQTGVWHHLAFTYDLTGGVSTLKLYANGVEVTGGQDGTPNLPITYDANPYPLLIGGEFENNAPGFTLDGQADEVSVYGRALSQMEIFDIVQAGSFGKCAPGSACTQAPNGLVSWYRGEGNALDSKSNNHGTLQNGSTFSSGRVGQSFSFDGVDDYVAAPDDNSLDITGDLTIEAWVNPAQIQAGSATLVDKRDPSNTNLNYVLFLVNGELRFVSRSGGGGFDENFSGVTLPAGTFSHVAVTIQNGALRFYINGVSSAALTAPATRPATTGRLIIGATETTSLSGFFNGSIDELSIYNRALTSSEISSIISAGANGKCLAYTCAQTPNNLVSWYAGDSNALDSRSNNHGALQNGATFQNGRVGQGFSFDGIDDRVVVPNSPSLNITGNQLTIEAWINPTTVMGDRQIVSMATGTGIPSPRKFGLFVQNGFLGFEVNTTNGYYGSVPTTGAIASGVYTHVAGVYNGSQVIWYVNGVAAGMSPLSGNIVSSTGNLTIGQFATDGASSFQGLIDEVGIYNRALTQTELQSIVNAGSSGKCKPIAPNPPANQIAWFTGDGETVDFTGLNSAGVLQGDTNYKVGRVGQAFNFDGNGDYITTADSPNWDFGTGDFAVEAWFNAPNPTGVQRIIAAGSEADGANNLWALGYGDIGAWGGGQRINLAVYNGGGYSDFSSSPVTFRPNTWHHVAVVRSGTAFTFYLDGVAVGTVPVGASFAVNGGNTGAIIGARYNQNPATIFEFANGRLDEISLYSRALSASEIAAVYNAGAAGKLKSVITSPPINFSENKARLAWGIPQMSTVELTSATVTFQNVSGSGLTSQSGIDLGFLPKLPEGSTFTGLAYDVSSTATYSGNVTVCFNLPTLSVSDFTDIRILHLEADNWINRTTTRNYPNICAEVPSLSPFAIVQGLAPTAASATLTGKVANSRRRGVSGVKVSITDMEGTTRTTRTNQLGNYYFNNLAVGETYVISVSSRKYTFDRNSQVLSLLEDLKGINFTAFENRNFDSSSRSEDELE